MGDRADRLNRRRKDFSQSDDSSPDNTDNTVKTDNTAGEAESDSAQSLSLTDTRKEQMMHLPEDQHRDLHRRYNRLKADYEYEFGGDFELNRHYFPLVIQYGLDQMSQQDIETIRDDLSSSDSEAESDG